jgi:NAD+ synthase (glutamine-hydrolysing)
LLLSTGFLTACADAFTRFARSVRKTAAVIGSVRGTGPVFNSAAVVQNGAVACVYDKQCLPNYGVFDEQRYFAPGTRAVSFDLGDVRLGLTICEDIWIDRGPQEILASEHQADCILNISASPFHAGKIGERRALLTARAHSLRTAIVYLNLVGGQDELVFDGGSLVYDAAGTCLLKAPLFEECLCHCDLAFELPHTGAAVGPCAALPAAEGPKPPVPPIMARDLRVEEEVLGALVTGTRDYIRKNGFSRAVIGLSGGIDSSLVATVAVRALGPEHVIGITMPSGYTSTGTRHDAEALARNLGIRFHEIPISRIYRAFTDELAPVFAGCAPDVTEENLQSRIRGTILMALSNKFGWLVLTTGNKSEMATGYATLYGDMAGGFAVIKDVPKGMVYRVSRLVNDQAGREIIPESVLTREPTAELRPGQRDADTLPPYDILDGVLKAYIEENAAVDDIAAQGFDRETVRDIIRMVDRSEYKRRQAPPGVKITPRAFGRDRRLPITNKYRPE